MEKELKEVMVMMSQKLDIIKEVSLVDEDYNDLHLKLVAAKESCRHLIKAERKISQIEEGTSFWEEMKVFRDPETPIEKIVRKEK